MSLSFNSIPVGIRTPGSFLEFNNSRTNQGLAIRPSKILILGQKLAAGAAAVATPVLVTGKDGVTAFGRGSMLDRMIRALRGLNSVTECWAMAVGDVGTAAVYTLTFTGPATAAGRLPLYIAMQYLGMTITSGMTATQIATAVAAAVNATTDLPFTATSAAGVVTLTCRWLGLTGNDLDIRLAYASTDAMPPGVTCAIALPTAGTGAPDITAAIAAMGDTQYLYIACPWTDTVNLTALSTEMAGRRGPMKMIEGVVFCAAKGSQGALASIGEAPNSPDISIAEAVGPTPTYERAARECGQIAYYGDIDPARPFQTLPLTGELAPAPTERFDRDERDALLHDGISTHTVDDGGNVLIERPITTYRLNAAGLADDSYLDVGTMLTLGYLRYTWRAVLAAEYPRHKLADDGGLIPPGQPIVTPKLLSARLVALAREWEAAGLVENVDAFKSLLVVQRNATDRSRVDAYIPPDLVSGFRVFAGQIDFSF